MLEAVLVPDCRGSTGMTSHKPANLKSVISGGADRAGRPAETHL